MYSEYSNKYEINQICRVCLNTETNYVDIFSSTSNISSISTAIMECAPITISETDTLPHAICTCCLEKLEIAYNFRKLCIQTDQTLRIKDETITPITKIDTIFDICEIKIEKSENSCGESFSDNDRESITTPKKVNVKKRTKNKQKETNSCTEYLSDNDRISDDNGEGVTTPKKRNVKKRTKKQPQTKKQPRTKKQSQIKLKRDQPKAKKIVAVRENDGLFHCKHCGKTYTNKKNFIVHTSSHTGQKVFCDKCNKSYNHIYQLRKHMIGVHGERKFSCEICGLTFPFLPWLKSHQHSHLTVNLFKCDICSKEFKWKQTLDKHQVTHTDVRPYACTECDKSFKRKDHLRVHVQKHFGKRYKCDLCSGAFISRASLKYHIANNCARTQMVVQDEEEMNRQFRCEICLKGFICKNHLEKHVTIHSDIRSFVCDECGESYKRKDHLAVHIQRTHGKRFRCDLCSQEFIFGEDLKSHILRNCSTTQMLIHDEQPAEINRQFQCEICSKEFRWKNHLEKHATVHSDVRSFVCDECGNSYKRKDHLVKHTQKTHGKRFKCDLCLQEFISGEDLKSHILSHCSTTQI